MYPKSLPLLAGLVALAALNGPAVAGVPPESLSGHDLAPLGYVLPRHAKDIRGSSWSVGGETLDRDFATYQHYKDYVGPLGAKAIRLQAGWAKCERTRGVYSFEWLDQIIDDAVAQGVRPWLEFSYGNPVYPGVGDTGLGGGLPSSPEALAGWDRWVRATLERYRDRVNAWEVWNEPDLNNRGTATVEAYTALYIRTARIVREVQPEGKVYALALAHTPEYAERFLDLMADAGELDLIDAITLHGYPRNPDDTAIIDRLRAHIATFGRAIEIRQGETGAPSKYQEHFALRNYSWTENTQAKWNLRRMLAHHVKGVAFNLFTLSDLHYRQRNNTSGAADGTLRMNYKGLVGTNPDQTVSHVKQAYYAAQSVFSLFDDTLVQIADFPFTTTALRGVSLSAFRRVGGNGQVIAYWFSDAPPAEANGVTRVTLKLPKADLQNPVLVDLRSSTVYEVPVASYTREKEGMVFRELPLYDSPLLLADRSAVPLTPTAPWSVPLEKER